MRGVKCFRGHRTVGGLGEQQIQPVSDVFVFDGGCLVFRCSLFMRLGAVQAHLASWITS